MAPYLVSGRLVIEKHKFTGDWKPPGEKRPIIIRRPLGQLISDCPRREMRIGTRHETYLLAFRARNDDKDKNGINLYGFITFAGRWFPCFSVRMYGIIVRIHYGCIASNIGLRGTTNKEIICPHKNPFRCNRKRIQLVSIHFSRPGGVVVVGVPKIFFPRLFPDKLEVKRKQRKIQNIKFIAK